MKKLALALGLTGLLVGATLLAAAEDKVPSIKQVMAKLNKGPNALMGQLGRELKQDEPDWATAQKGAREFAAFAGHLVKNEPPKGSKESWNRLAKSYVDNAIALQKAVENKDRTAAQAQYDRLKKSCGACHKAHKGK